MHQPDSQTAGRPASRPAGQRDLTRARETQPPPADAEAPASAAPDPRDAITPSPPYWPGSGAPKPTTYEEAEANLATIRSQRIVEGDARHRQAKVLLRELAPSNGHGSITGAVAASDVTVPGHDAELYRLHQPSIRVVDGVGVCDRCAPVPVPVDVL